MSKEDIYGYELLEKLQSGGFQLVREGTIYPLLLRLEKEKLITSYFGPSPSGPRRKYYKITDDGIIALNVFKENWFKVEESVNFFLNLKLREDE
ncbi:PadR family transcriptional regulator [Bacillus sp. V3B]|uniref:PadR family transcriptional regulator n=1 Tax=Bacillus sp. V3B TaxID=2804915 RepID=UPI0035C75407